MRCHSESRYIGNRTCWSLVTPFYDPAWGVYSIKTSGSREVINLRYSPLEYGETTVGRMGPG